jgi:hypothetical protein
MFTNTYVSQLTDTGRFLLPEVPLWLRPTASSPLEPSSLHECASGECCDSLEVPLGLATCGCDAAPLAADVALMALWLERAVFFGEVETETWRRRRGYGALALSLSSRNYYWATTSAAPEWWLRSTVLT